MLRKTNKAIPNRVEHIHRVFPFMLAIFKKSIQQRYHITLCSYRHVNLVNVSFFWVCMNWENVDFVVRRFKKCLIFFTGFESGALQCYKVGKPLYENAKGYAMHDVECIGSLKLLIEKNIAKKWRSNK